MPPRAPLLTRALRPRPLLRNLHNQPTTTTRTYTSATSPSSRLERIIKRLPSPLRKFMKPLIGAPGTHITSFLILHELTAIVPLVGLATVFHWTGWLPFQGALSGERIKGYESMFARWFGRRGWFGVEKPGSVAGQEETDEGQGGLVKTEAEGGEYGQGTRVVLEVAMAYAITKAMLPLRIVGSVWATPWFARNVLGRVVALVKRVRR